MDIRKYQIPHPRRSHHTHSPWPPVRQTWTTSPARGPLENPSRVSRLVDGMFEAAAPGSWPRQLLDHRPEGTQ